MSYQSDLYSQRIKNLCINTNWESLHFQEKHKKWIGDSNVCYIFDCLIDVKLVVLYRALFGVRGIYGWFSPQRLI